LNHLEIRKNLNDFTHNVAGNSSIPVSLNTGVQTQTCLAKGSNGNLEMTDFLTTRSPEQRAG